MNLKFKPQFLHSQETGSGAGAGAGAQDRAAENALIEKIKTTVAEQVRSLNDSEDTKKKIETIFNKSLENLSEEQLRKFEEKSKVKESVTELATKLEKLEQRMANAQRFGNLNVNENVLKQVLEARFSEIENVLAARSDKNEFQLTVNRAAEIITTDNIVDLTDVDKDALDSLTITSFVPKRRPNSYIFDIADHTTSASLQKSKTWLSEGDEEGAFAIVEEGGLKPLVSVGLVKNASEAKKVAGRTVYTDEVAKFKKEYYNIIRRLINDKLLRDYRKQLTIALVAAASPYASSALDGQYTNPTDFHAIAAVAAQIESLDFIPDTLVINPQDKWRIGMAQNDNGSFYLNIPIASPDGMPTLLGFNVITSNEIEVGKFILGESGLWKIEDEAITVKIGYGVEQTKDANGFVKDVQHDLDHNRFRVISEMWFHSYIDSAHEGSFVYGDFAAIKELLTKEEDAPVVEG